MNMDREDNANQFRKIQTVKNFFMISVKNAHKDFILIKIGNALLFLHFVSNMMKTVVFVHLVTMDMSYLKNLKVTV